MTTFNKNSRTESMQQLLGDARFRAVVLVLLALVARLAFFLISGWYGQIINNDAYEYLAIAANLGQGRGLGSVVVGHG